MQPNLKASPRSVCAELNRLILTCKEDVLVYGAAASIVSDLHARDLFLERSQRRAVFVGELSALIVALGGTPEQRARRFTRFSGLLHGYRGTILGFVGGVHDSRSYDACAHAAAKSEGVYEDVLRSPLTDDAQTTIERQHAEIARDSVELRRQRFLH